ncbi:MAG: leucine--tRNA ligase [Alphaproteobacteria bacterium CG11_big_fil_rev_8_21_14_0_20_44_7]|nr:MAG: leucine--tRNA ligase [Alphaproteobacteria bacterium CG11_big_fil_rev_8_21_14_0_20_44_7]
MTYDPQQIESKWQKFWDESQSFKPEPISSKPKAYVLEMFPYPSGRIHMGHLRNYTIGDAIARYKRSKGFNVLHPMGWDAFGLPAENAAIENNVNPADWTYQNIDNMRVELKKIGLSYDWEREIATCHPEYYKHEQAFFLSFIENGLAYQKEATVNWDPVDNTVLANEQVIDGRGWRSGALVERKKLKQWFLRISDFSEDLLEGLKELNGWPDSVRLMQEKWIGKSIGAEIEFEIVNAAQSLSANNKLKVFTTRPDTIFGASFCAIAPGHPIAEQLSTTNHQLSTFIEECNQIANTEEAMEKAEKKGFDTGLRIKHPFIEGLELPLYVANFILMEYGTGAIFGCPAHDERDREFAEKYNLPIKEVVGEDGILHSSEFLNGLDVESAKTKAIEEFEKLGCGKKQITYRLRDWGVSRQRYWGCPIPIIYCDDCGAVPVPKTDLPVELPKDVSFEKLGNPLDNHPTWKHVDCPKCGGKAERETDTFDTFFESSWYFARFCSTNDNNPLENADKFLPVDNYVGGIEHAVLHLLYSRFFTRALTKCGYINIKEPFKNLLTQGMVCHPTYKNSKGEWIYPEDADENSVKGGSVKMSKSKKNVVDPTKIVEKYGADTARLFMLSDSPPERDLEWSDEGVEGSYKFLKRLWSSAIAEMPEEADNKKHIHRAIKDVTADFEGNHFNKAVANIRTLFNELNKNPSREGYKALLALLFPLTPHISAEIAEKIGAEATNWPQFDEKYLQEDSVNVAVQVNGKKRAIVTLPLNADEAKAKEIALTHENVVNFIENGIKKFIYVPNKIINIVA